MTATLLQVSFITLETLCLSVFPYTHFLKTVLNAKNRKLELIMSFIVWSLQRYEFSSYFFAEWFTVTSFV